MGDWMKRQGLPVQYGVLGGVGGVIALLLGQFIEFFAPADIGTVIACAVGGALGGAVRQWTRKG